MENKLVKIIGQIGNLLLVSIDGKKFKAKVEGNIPSSMFLGEIIKDRDKLIVKVKEPVILSKSLEAILSEMNITKSRNNLLITKLLLLFSLPIEERFYSIFRDYNLPFMVMALVLKSNKEPKKFLFLLEKILKEDNKDKLSNSELELFVNNFFLNSYEEFKIFNIENFGEKWYGYFESDGSKMKKFVFTTTIEDVDIVVVFENIKHKWNLELSFFGDIDIDKVSTEGLKLKLEELGFKPISIEVGVFGGRK